VTFELENPMKYSWDEKQSNLVTKRKDPGEDFGGNRDSTWTPPHQPLRRSIS
jgi:hypothetical protein